MGKNLHFPSHTYSLATLWGIFHQILASANLLSEKKCAPCFHFNLIFFSEIANPSSLWERPVWVKLQPFNTCATSWARSSSPSTSISKRRAPTSWAASNPSISNILFYPCEKYSNRSFVELFRRKKTRNLWLICRSVRLGRDGAIWYSWWFTLVKVVSRRMFWPRNGRVWKFNLISWRRVSTLRPNFCFRSSTALSLMLFR